MRDTPRLKMGDMSNNETIVIPKLLSTEIHEIHLHLSKFFDLHKTQESGLSFRFILGVSRAAI